MLSPKTEGSSLGELAKGPLGELAKGPLGELAKGPLGELAKGSLSTMMSVAAPGNAPSTSSQISAPPQVTEEEKHDAVLRAYRGIIEKYESSIASRFNESVDSYLKAHFDIENAELNAFIRDTLFQQINAFFQTVNTQYVMYAYMHALFTKHLSLITKMLVSSVQNAGIGLEAISPKDIDLYASDILDAFKNELGEIQMQDTMLRGGGPMDDANRIAEIATWFPDDATKDDVNRDIKYIVQQVFVDTMRKSQRLAIAIDKMLSTHIFPLLIQKMKSMIDTQDIYVDVALLQTVIDSPSGKNVMIKAIRDALTEFITSGGMSATVLATSIYTRVIQLSIEKYNERAPQPAKSLRKTVSGGSRRRQRTRKTRRYRKTPR